MLILRPNSLQYIFRINDAARARDFSRSDQGAATGAGFMNERWKAGWACGTLYIGSTVLVLNVYVSPFLPSSLLCFVPFALSTHNWFAGAMVINDPTTADAPPRTPYTAAPAILGTEVRRADGN
jgi:hypothetical protein